MIGRVGLCLDCYTLQCNKTPDAWAIMDWYYLVSFALMAAVIEISPGPNFLLIARSVSTVGRSVALANIPGFSVAFALHGALSIYGVSTVIQSKPELLLMIQVAGAAYLFYLGVQSLNSDAVSDVVNEKANGTPLVDVVTERVHGRPIVDVVLAPASATWDGSFHASNNTRESLRNGGVDIELDKHVDLVSDTQSIGRCFLDGFITNILNPKIALFYIAAFPLLLNTGVQTSGSSFVLVLIHVLINAMWFISVAYVLNYLVCRSLNGRFVTVIRYLSGYALIALSLVFVAHAI